MVTGLCGQRESERECERTGGRVMTVAGVGANFEFV